ncbi:MAG: T9SS type A sorting domain-containing protein [Bacteroidota bacterium]
MKKITHIKSDYWQPILKRVALMLCLLAGLFFNTTAQVVLNTEILPTDTEDELSVAITVDNFTDIASFQFSVNWDIQSLVYDTIGNYETIPGINVASFNLNLTETGEMSIAWFSADGLGTSVPNGSTIFVLHFTKLTEVPSELFFDNTPTIIEFGEVGGLVPVTSNTNDIVLDKHLLVGRVLFDENGNCVDEASEKGLVDWLIEIKGNNTTRYERTNATGNFATYLPFGDFEVKAIPPPNNYFEPCESIKTVTISETATDATSISFTGKAAIECPSLHVEIGAPFLRRCFENTYVVQYGNRGSAVANDVFITVALDDDLDFVSSTIPSTNVEGNTYRFDVGDLGISENGTFYLKFVVNCDRAELGETHCTTAKIFPDLVCEAPANWSGASLELESECVDDKVQLRIKNIGDGDMNLEQEFIVVEDMIMLRTGNPQRFNLVSGAVETIEYPANGSTYRLETKQVPNHPNEGLLATAIEGCGTDENGEFSKGMINMFALGDESPFVDEDCQENRGAYDPNDKNAFPQGYNTSHFLAPNTDIEYLIRFQNTGTDTAFNVVVLDTISALLDVASIVPLTSSHPYELSIVDSNVLKYAFPNIMLPDSNVNLVESNGFFKFQISQKPDVVIGEIIENSAAIYFDFNDPIITNTYFHTVGFDFVEVRVITSINELSPVLMKISPNPMREVARIQVENPHHSDGQFELFDLQGRQVRSYEFSGNTFELHKGDLNAGMYLFEVRSEGQLLGTGKVMIKE